jgi:hypothetical protein
MRSFVPFALSLSLSILPFMACSSTEPTEESAPAPGGAYRGLLTGPKETGVLDVTLGAAVKTAGKVGLLTASSSGVSGTITIAGGTVSLTGSYDPATGQLTLTGSNANGTYALAGTTSSSGFTGTYAGPNGSAGVWSLTSAATGAAELYCGTYSTAAGQLVGVFNLVIGSGVGTGAHCDAKDCGALTATVSGTTITITDPAKPNNPPSTGTISGGMTSGTIPGANGGGTFTGSTSACSAAPPPPPPPVDSGTDAPPIMDAGADAAAVLETLAANVNDPVALSLDATHVYWLSAGDAAIRRCPLAGCGAGPETVVSSLSVSSSVAVDNGKLFWTSGFRYLMTCTVGTGGTCTPTQYLDLGAAVNSYPAHLWVSGTRLYWVAENAQARMIQTCALTGCTTGAAMTVYTSAAGSLIHNAPLAGLVVNATDAYLTSFTGGVFRYPLTNPDLATAGNGTQVQPSAYQTSGLDLDGTTMRWGLLGDGKIVECTTPACTTVSDFVKGQLAPGETRSNATYVYGFNRGTPKVGASGYNAGTGSVWRIKK